MFGGTNSNLDEILKINKKEVPAVKLRDAENGPPPQGPKFSHANRMSLTRTSNVIVIITS